MHPSLAEDGPLSMSTAPQPAQKLLPPSRRNCTFYDNVRLANIGRFADQTFAKQLEADLNEADDSKRKLKELTPLSANQLFSVLGLDDPDCDANDDGVIKGDELKCLNFAWKAYLPQ